MLPSFRFLRSLAPLAAVSALLFATACGGSVDPSGDSSCTGEAPSCGTACGSPLTATCSGGAWVCSNVETVDCPALPPDGGTCDVRVMGYCGTDCAGNTIPQACVNGQWTCTAVATPACLPPACGDVEPDCGTCGGAAIAPVCTSGGWTCPAVNCPIDPYDGRAYDGGPGDGGDEDGGEADGGVDGGEADGGDADADGGIGDVCEEGAACLPSMTCAIAGPNGSLACSCVRGAYSCH